MQNTIDYQAFTDDEPVENEGRKPFEITDALARYFNSVPRRKTETQEKYVLPCGQLIRKKQAPLFALNDDELIPFLQANGLSEFVKLKASSDWAGLKKACTVLEDGSVVEQSTGMVLPGVKAEFRPEKFEVKIDG